MTDNPKFTMVAVFLEDHKRIKDIAAYRKMKIVDLIHEWIDQNNIPGVSK